MKKSNLFHFEDNLLYQGDSFLLLDKVQNNSVDLILSDPPYGIADSSKLTKVKSKVVSTKTAWGKEFQDKWDSIEEYRDWLLRIVEKSIGKLKEEGSIVLFLDRKYTGYFIELFERKFGLIFRNKLYFIKNNPLPKFRKSNYRSCVEEAIWLSKSKKYYIDFIDQVNMKQIFFGNIGRKDTQHPTEKYRWMIEPIIRRHTKEKDVILDPFFGSGATGIVASELGRNWIGIEQNQEYIDMFKKRSIQSRLF